MFDDRDVYVDRVGQMIMNGIDDVCPCALPWMRSALCGAILSMIDSNRAIATTEDAMDAATTFLRAMRESLMQGAKLKQELSDTAFERLYDVCMSQGWGALTIEVKAGVPAMVREYRRDIKLSV